MVELEGLTIRRNGIHIGQIRIQSACRLRAQINTCYLSYQIGFCRIDRQIITAAFCIRKRTSKLIGTICLGKGLVLSISDDRKLVSVLPGNRHGRSLIRSSFGQCYTAKGCAIVRQICLYGYGFARCIRCYLRLHQFFVATCRGCYHEQSAQ